MAHEENAATALVRLVIRRESGTWYNTRFAWLAGLIIWASALGFSWWSSPRDPVSVWLWLGPLALLGFFLVFVLIAGRWDREGALLLTFQRGGCLDEILATRMTPAELVDGLAWSSTCRVAGLLAPFFAFCSFSVGGLAWTAFPPGDFSLPLLAAGMLLLLAVGIPVASYLNLANSALTAGKDDRPLQSVRTLMVAGVVGPPLVGGIVGVALGPGSFLAAVLLGAVWAVGWSRAASVWALGRGGELQGSLRWLSLGRLFRPRRPNPWLKPWNENPIVGREVARESHRVPFGLLGALLVRGGFGFLLGTGFLAFLAAVGALGEPWAWITAEIFLALSGLVLFSFCSSRSVDLVVTEHEARTLPQLLATPLTVGELAAGVVSVAVRPCLLQYAGFAGPLVVGALFSSGAASPALLPEALLPVLAAATGAWLGVQAAAPVPTRQQALTRAGNLSACWVAGTGGFLLGAALLLNEWVPFRVVYVAVCLLSGGVALSVVRAMTLAALVHKPAEGTVGLAPGT